MNQDAHSLFLAATDSHTAQLLLSLFVVFVAAKVAAEIFERLGQPAVVGEILAGVAIGPSALMWVQPSEAIDALSEIGVIFLLFVVGLEVKPSTIFRVGRVAMLVAVGGVVLPFVVGWALMAFFWDAPTVESVFVAAAMVATSVGITARVLAGMGLLRAEVSQIILGAAVIDDILGLLVLSIVAGIAGPGGQINYVEIGLTAGLAIAFTLFTLFLGPRVAAAVAGAVNQLRVEESFFVFALALCLGFSLVATEAGVAPIIGAFLAGMALSEVSEHTKLHHQVGAVTEFLVPFFLVSIGLQVDLRVFTDTSVVALAVALTVLAVLTKLVGCGLPALSLGKRAALQIGMGMVPRGEVGIIVAKVGLSLGVLTGALYGVVVFMAVATTLIAPPFLTRLFAGVEVEEDTAEAAARRERLSRDDLW